MVDRYYVHFRDQKAGAQKGEVSKVRHSGAKTQLTPAFHPKVLPIP